MTVEVRKLEQTDAAHKRFGATLPMCYLPTDLPWVSAVCPVSSSDMEPGRVKWLAPFLKEAAAWAVFLWGLAVGLLGTTLCAGTSTGLSSKANWPGLIGLILFGFIPLLASILALRNRRQAANLFVLAALVVAGILIITGIVRRVRYGEFDGEGSLVESSLVIAEISAILFLPGLFWLLTGRRGWRPLVAQRASTETPCRQPIILNTLMLSVLMLGSAFASLYLPFDFNCYKGGRPVSVQTSPRHAVFTGRVLVVARPLHSWGSPWALLHVEHVYWGLPRWMRGIVFVRGYFKETDKGQQYFVDAVRNDGALTRFLPVVDFYRCCHTTLLKYAEVDLRIVRDGPPKSGVRIIGRVYDLRDSKGGMAVQDSPILVTGTTGPISTRTDKDGVYDFRDLPPGHYSIRVGPRDHGSDLKTGDVWEVDFYLPADAPR